VGLVHPRPAFKKRDTELIVTNWEDNPNTREQKKLSRAFMETLVLNWPQGRNFMCFPYYDVASSVWETASMVTSVQHHRLFKGQIMGPKLSQNR